MWWRWPNFTPAEMACKDGTPFPIDDPVAQDFMDKLQALRLHFPFSFIVNSGYRTIEYNKQINGAPNSAHTKACAVDLSIYGERAFRLVAAAPSFGFVGIGVSQKGDPAKRFIHLDTLAGDKRPTIWSY